MEGYKPQDFSFFHRSEKLVQQGKPIIGVFCLGAKDSDIPEALAELADSIVGWRKDKIEAAVEGKLSFENADGSSRSDVTVARGQC